MHELKRHDLVSRPEDTSAVEVVRLAAGASPLAMAAAAAGVHVNSPPSNMVPWGAPMPAPPAPAPTGDRSTPDNGSSWGRTDTLQTTDPPHEMCRVQLDVTTMLTLTITITQPPLTGRIGQILPIDVPLTVWAKVTVGAGSGSVTRLVKLGDQLSIPLVCSYLSASCYIGDLDGALVTGDVFANGPSAQVNVQVARGVRGIPGQATAFVAASGTNVSLVGEPCRLASITAHLATTSGAPLFLQLFDLGNGPIGAGAVPVAEYALGTTPSASDIGDELRWLNGFPFSQGCQAGVSTTSGVFVEAGVGAWCQVEVVLL